MLTNKHTQDRRSRSAHIQIEQFGMLQMVILSAELYDMRKSFVTKITSVSLVHEWAWLCECFGLLTFFEPLYPFALCT